MRKFARKNVAALVAVAVVFTSLLLTNYVGWLRLKPEVSAVTWISIKAGVENHIINIQDRAEARVRPGNPEAYLPIYDVRNPGLFLLVAELYVRAGATTPVPLEITSMALFNVGALCFFFWVRFLFSDLIAAAFATAFLLLSQFFLFSPGITHTVPYEFVFFNVTMLLYMLYLKHNKAAYLVGALVAMFLTCMNYWFYYMSSWIIMIGLWWQYRGRPSIRDVAMLSAPPVAAASLTTIMVMSLFGGVASGAMRLYEIFAARTIDARVPGGQWMPNEIYMHATDWPAYPGLVMERLQWAYSIDVRWFAASAGCTLLLLWFRKRSSAVSALILLAGGFSWYYVMFQHTFIHTFAGEYSFMAICPIAGLIVSETMSFASTTWRRVSAIPGAATDLSATRSVVENRERAITASRTRWAVAAATFVVVVSSTTVWSYFLNTYSLVRQTQVAARTVEAK
jgi:hypothetical protein